MLKRYLEFRNLLDFVLGDQLQECFIYSVYQKLSLDT